MTSYDALAALAEPERDELLARWGQRSVFARLGQWLTRSRRGGCGDP